MFGLKIMFRLQYKKLGRNIELEGAVSKMMVEAKKIRVYNLMIKARSFRFYNHSFRTFLCMNDTERKKVSRHGVLNN